jgi:molybdenum cofactor guanylyltransferase
MISIAIQAGGRSQRMGQDKALVPLGGIPLIEHILERVDGLADEILITTNHPHSLEYLGLRMVADPIPGAGALDGLHTALSSANGDFILVLACDMPFVQRRLIEAMLELTAFGDVIIPMIESFYEPLHAVYSKNCLPAVGKALANGEKRMISFFPEVSVHPIDRDLLSQLDPRGISTFNVNTPKELQTAEMILEDLRTAPESD